MNKFRTENVKWLSQNPRAWTPNDLMFNVLICARPVLPLCCLRPCVINCWVETVLNSYLRINQHISAYWGNDGVDCLPLMWTHVITSEKDVDLSGRWTFAALNQWSWLPSLVLLQLGRGRGFSVLLKWRDCLWGSGFWVFIGAVILFFFLILS